MAVILKAVNLSAAKKAGLPQPIIFCQSDPSITDSAVSLNVALAEKLTAVKPNRRTMRLEQCFRQVLDSFPDNPVIQDFDVLFNPDWKTRIIHWQHSILH